MSLVIANGTLACLKPPMVRRANLIIDGDVIQRVEDHLPPGNHEIFDAKGRLVMPGNVCGHTHLYSVLARGMPPPSRAPRNFREILELIWWRLDRALDEDSIRASGLIGAIEALQSGTTTLIDHHASPNYIDGSLDVLGQAMDQVGVRGVLCYETTDRNGVEGRDQALRENQRFASSVAARWPNLRAMVGAHASFTLDDDSLDALARTASELNVGVHIHVAEDLSDQEDSLRRAGKRVAHRLDDHSIITPRSLLAHGVHLDQAEARLIGERRGWLAHNCRSNLNNSVGRAPFASLLENLKGRVVLGTDGIDQDMFSESRSAYFRFREDTLDAHAEQLTEALAAGNDLIGESFGRPAGRLEPGNLADIVISDYDPPTPLTAENLAWHWMFAFTSRMVKDVMVGGDWMIRDGSPVNVDEEEVRITAREQAVGLWKRMQDLAG